MIGYVREFVSRRWLWVVFAPLLLCAPVSSRAQSAAEPVSIGRAVTLESSVLGEDRRILISPPRNYATGSGRYAVLYVTDGIENFPHISTLVSFLSENDLIPPMLVVAIGGEDRNRDFLTPPADDQEAAIAPSAGGADTFFRFLNSELVPWVGAHYRTNGYRVLFGHSFGGFFSIYSMLEHSEAFDGYIAASPSVFWNHEQLLQLTEADPSDGRLTGKTLYVTLADAEGDDAEAQVDRLMAAMNRSDESSFRRKFQRLEGEIHTSTPHRTVYDGLRFIFDGWYLADPMTMYDELGIGGIHDHFKEMDRKFGYERGTPASVIAQIGMDLFESGRLDDVASLIKYDPRNYPTAPNDIDSLARAYRDRGDTEKATEFYTMSLMESPSNGEARRGLIDLGADPEKLLDALGPSEDLIRSLAGRYRMPNGDDWVFRVIDRGLVLYLNGAIELVMLSPTEYTVGPGILYFDFDVGAGGAGVSMRVRRATTDWEQAVKLE